MTLPKSGNFGAAFPPAAPIEVKFCTAKQTHAPIGRAKFDVSLCNESPLRGKQAQLMLTNLRDAFGGQSRSSNIVPFHMLGIVSYCAVVTLS